jgi:hypothetical protein
MAWNPLARKDSGVQQMITSLQNLRDQSSALLTKVLWQSDINRFSPFKALLIRQLRIIF